MVKPKKTHWITGDEDLHYYTILQWVDTTKQFIVCFKWWCIYSVHLCTYIYRFIYIYVCVYAVYPSVIKHDNRKSTIQFDDFPAFLNLSFLGDLPLLGFDFRRVCIFSYKQHLWHLWLLYYVI